MPTQYSDLTHTLFPWKTDDNGNHPYMKDVTATQAASLSVQNYNYAVMRGDTATAESILKNNPDLVDSIFNAEKYNWMRDAIIATQRYYTQDVHAMINTIAAHTVGFDDDNSEGHPESNGYTISKIMSMIRGTTKPVDSSAGTGLINMLRPGVWGGTMPHTYLISIPGITEDDNIDVSLDPTATEAQAKAWSKAMVLSATQSANSITLNAYGKITSDVNIPIIIKVHN